MTSAYVVAATLPWTIRLVPPQVVIPLGLIAVVTVLIPIHMLARLGWMSRRWRLEMTLHAIDEHVRSSRVIDERRNKVTQLVEELDRDVDRETKALVDVARTAYSAWIRGDQIAPAQAQAWDQEIERYMIELLPGYAATRHTRHLA